MGPFYKGPFFGSSPGSLARVASDPLFLAVLRFRALSSNFGLRTRDVTVGCAARNKSPEVFICQRGAESLGRVAQTD